MDSEYSELLDEVNLFLFKHHIDFKYHMSLVFATAVLRINRKMKNRDFEGIMNIFLHWYEGEFKMWDGDTWKTLETSQITTLFMMYFDYWDEKDSFNFNYRG